ncbi:MAG: cysteine synthase A [Thermoplasmata archaeon]
MRKAKPLDSILEAIGDTPVVRLGRIVPGDVAAVYAKIESLNPMGSVKDRIAKGMIDDAERRGFIREGTTIIEPTSGNMGIGLAMVCAVRGYRLVLTMPDTMSVERRRLLEALGAELVLTPGDQGMSGAVQRADDLSRTVADSIVLQQFRNESNPTTHARTTAVEITETFDSLDAFVAGVGSGGTISGVGRVLKREFPGIKIIAVEPADSAVLSGKKPGAHGIQGIGAGFVPEILDTSIYDSVVAVSTEDASTTARALARREGLFVGISSGAAVHAALDVAKELGPGKSVLVVLPDTGERYLSTNLFEGESHA